MWKDAGLDKWTKKNLNFKNWGKSISKWFGGGSSGPPPNVSRYGNIQMPTQHSSFGFNWTYLSEGKPFSRFIYEFFNGFNTTGQYFMGRGVGDYSMRNLNGSATTTDEAVWGLVGAVTNSTAINEAIAPLTQVKIYRAVDAVEFNIIKNSRKFSVGEGGVESKYFAKSIEDAHWYGKALYPDGYTIIKARIKPPVKAANYWYPYVDIGAYVFPQETLPYIIPYK